MSMISELVEELIDNADSYTKELHDLMYRAANTIEMLSEKAREPKQGEWVDSDGDIYCSNCGAEAPIDEWEYKYRDKIRQERTNFCPNCGARMVK